MHSEHGEHHEHERRPEPLEVVLSARHDVYVHQEGGISHDQVQHVLSLLDEILKDIDQLGRGSHHPHPHRSTVP